MRKSNISRKKIKVIYLSHTSELHGAGNALFNLIDKLDSDLFSINVVLPTNNGPLYQKINNLGINCYIIPIRLAILPLKKNNKNILRIIRFYLFNIFTFFKLCKLIVKIKPDIIHSNVGPIHIGSILSKIFSIKHVWHLREFQDLHFGWSPLPTKKSFMNKIKKKHNYIIPVTKAIAEHYEISVNNVIYDGVFSISNYPIIITNKNKYFLFVGRLEESKGISDTISSFIKIADQIPEYELWIAGDGTSDYISKLKEIIYINNISDKVKFLGFRFDVYDLMSKATALIVASKYEAFGFITAEAMLNGCLVIGRDTGGTKEQLNNGYNLFQEEIGLRFTNCDELAACMLTVSGKNIQKYFKTMQFAQKTVLKFYSIEENIKIITSLYKNLLNK